jgi:hypothetical protein
MFCSRANEDNEETRAEGEQLGDEQAEAGLCRSDRDCNWECESKDVPGVDASRH